MKLFISPHCDDETLFGAFTLLREKPTAVIVFDSYLQEKRRTGITAETRRKETLAACAELGCDVRFLGFRDDDPDVSAPAIQDAIAALKPTAIWSPAFDHDGHPQHNIVANACDPWDHTRYLTYTREGKDTEGREVPIEDGSWITKKLRALACYESQHRIDPRIGCWPHFVNDLREYYL